MTPTRRNAARWLIMSLTLGLIALAMLALACGPSAPAGQTDEPVPESTIPWLGTPPSESALATLRAMPAYTPYPPGYVKPTDLPTETPRPTIDWSHDQMSTERAAVGADSPSLSESEQLLEELREFALSEHKRDFIIARIQVGSTSRDVHYAFRQHIPASDAGSSYYLSGFIAREH